MHSKVTLEVMECSICLRVTNAKNGYVTTCQHTFHSSCLNLWVKGSKVASCPICRKSLDCRETYNLDCAVADTPMSLGEFISTPGVEICQQAIILDLCQFDWLQTFATIVKLKTQTRRTRTYINIDDYQVYFLLPKTQFIYVNNDDNNTVTCIMPTSDVITSFDKKLVSLANKAYPHRKIQPLFHPCTTSSTISDIQNSVEIQVNVSTSDIQLDIVGYGSILIEIQFVQFGGTVSTRAILKDFLCYE